METAGGLSAERGSWHCGSHRHGVRCSKRNVPAGHSPREGAAGPGYLPERPILQSMTSFLWGPHSGSKLMTHCRVPWWMTAGFFTMSTLKVWEETDTTKQRSACLALLSHTRWQPPSETISTRANLLPPPAQERARLRPDSARTLNTGQRDSTGGPDQRTQGHGRPAGPPWDLLPPLPLFSIRYW